MTRYYSETTGERRQNAKISALDFGVVDERGRRMGALIDFYEFDLVEVEEAEREARTRSSDVNLRCRGYFNAEPGHYFAYCPHATRNGRRFGALQATPWFKTEAEREAAVAKYLNGAQRRAMARTKKLEATPA